MLSFERAVLLRLWRVDAERVISQDAIARYRALGGHLNLKAFVQKRRARRGKA